MLGMAKQSTVDALSDRLANLMDELRGRQEVIRELRADVGERRDANQDHQIRVEGLQSDKEYLESRVQGLESSLEARHRELNEAKGAADATALRYQRVFEGLGRRDVAIKVQYYPHAVGGRVSFLVAFHPRLKALHGAYLDGEALIDRLAGEFPVLEEWTWGDGILSHVFGDLNETVLQEIERAETQLQGNLTRFLQVQAYGRLDVQEEVDSSVS